MYEFVPLYNDWKQWKSQNQGKIEVYEGLPLGFSGNSSVILALHNGENKGNPKEKSVCHNTIQILGKVSEHLQWEDVHKIEYADDHPHCFILFFCSELS